MFPTITIALGWILLFFKLRYNATNDDAWMQAYFYFTKVFALTFALGVVSGITMSFQFGTNWPGFMETVGNVAGPLLAYEVLTAFFLEATFLGIMLFGFSRVSGWVHTLATFLVAAGTTLSAFWIIALNSWMHTPQGFEMIANEAGQLQAHATSWSEIIFNPSMPYRLTHMLIASGLTASFLVAGISAFRWLINDRTPTVMKSMKTGVFIAAFLIPVQIFVGDLHGLNTKEHQPAKVAAMEGIWETQKGVPLVLFGIPNSETKRIDYAIEIPKLASFILTHDWNGEVQGVDAFEYAPSVTPIFLAFRIMVGMGLMMLIISWTAAYFLWRRKDIPRPLAFVLVGMTFSGWVATISGWYVTEIGRQPWLVHGVLKAEEALGPISGGMVATTLSAYLVTYVVLLIAYISTLIHMAKRAGDGSHRDPLKPSVQGAERRTILTAAK
ncbi:MAG: cytochrome d ubiquinol oxidase subunit I [Alcanivorax sp.]|jgi:cytochrome d ubiquinol oxidase subunit I